MQFSKNFFKSIATVSFITGVLIALMWLLWFIPEFQNPVTIDGSLLLSYFKIGGRKNFWHSITIIPTILAIFTLFGVFAKKWNEKKGLVLTALVSSVTASIFSIISPTISLFPWRQSWFGLPFQKHNIFDFSSGTLLMIGFLLFSLSLWKDKGAGKTLSIFFLITFILLAINIIVILFDMPVLLMNICIPILLIITIFLIGIWIREREINS